MSFFLLRFPPFLLSESTRLVKEETRSPGLMGGTFEELYKHKRRQRSLALPLYQIKNVDKLKMKLGFLF